VSQITSSAASAPGTGAAGAPPELPSRAHDDTAARFEGLLFAGALAPLSKELGVLGDVLTEAIATAIARGSHDDFYRRLRTLADRPKDA
jgi:hypothetical protein